MNRYVERLTCLVISLVISDAPFRFLMPPPTAIRKKCWPSSKDGTDVNTTFPIVGTHALMVAAAFGHVDMVRVLIDRGADVTLKI